MCVFVCVGELEMYVRVCVEVGVCGGWCGVIGCYFGRRKRDRLVVHVIKSGLISPQAPASRDFSG